MTIRDNKDFCGVQYIHIIPLLQGEGGGGVLLGYCLGARP